MQSCEDGERLVDGMRVSRQVANRSRVGVVERTGEFSVIGTGADLDQTTVGRWKGRDRSRILGMLETIGQCQMRYDLAGSMVVLRGVRVISGAVVVKSWGGVVGIGDWV